VVLTFTNTMRDHANPTGVTTTIMKAKQEKQAIARVKINGNAGNDEAILYFNANASNSYDNYDSPKMFESVSAAIPEIYTQIGSEKLVINGMNTVPYETEIPVGFITKQAGDFTISANELSNFEAGTRVLLLDKNYPNVETELTTGTVYNFSAPVTAANTNRFSLLFRAPGASTGFNSAEKLNAQVYVNAANQIVISASEKASYSIYNAVGMLVENGQTTGKLQTVNCKLQTGMYVVKVNNETRRVIIK
jgi:biopolymer transport protein ExbD